jgi:hypothetical protein
MNPRQARWAALIADFASSGLTIDRYCEHRGVAVSSFYSWKRRLGDCSSIDRRRPAFVEAVVDDHHPACASGCSAPVVELRCGRRIAVPQGFDEATLARLVVLLERLDIAGSREVRA